jgi:hypothetical protein
LNGASRRQCRFSHALYQVSIDSSSRCETTFRASSRCRGLCPVAGHVARALLRDARHLASRRASSVVSPMQASGSSTPQSLTERSSRSPLPSPGSNGQTGIAAGASGRWREPGAPGRPARRRRSGRRRSRGGGRPRRRSRSRAAPARSSPPKRTRSRAAPPGRCGAAAPRPGSGRPYRSPHVGRNVGVDGIRPLIKLFRYCLGHPLDWGH